MTTSTQIERTRPRPTGRRARSGSAPRGGRDVRAAPIGGKGRRGQTDVADVSGGIGARVLEDRLVRIDSVGSADLTQVHKPSHPRQLTPQQTTAIELIVTGRTDAEVAVQVGVTRETVNRWRNWNPLFMAAMNELRLGLWKATRERLRTLNAKALDVIEQHVQAGSLKAALALLKYANEEKMPNGSTTLPGVVDDLAENIDLTLMLKDMHSACYDNSFARALRRIWLDAPKTDNTDSA